MTTGLNMIQYRVIILIVKFKNIPCTKYSFIQNTYQFNYNYYNNNDKTV